MKKSMVVAALIGVCVLFVGITPVRAQDNKSGNNDNEVSASASEDQIKDFLESKRMDFQAPGMPMQRALNVFQDILRGYFSGRVDVNVKRSAINHINGLPKQLSTVNLQVEDLPVKDVAKRLLKPRDLTLSYRQGSLEIAPFDEVHKPFLNIYDIKDLTLKILDFPGPKLELKSPSKSGGGGKGGGFLGPQFSNSGAEKGTSALSNEQKLKDLIKNNTGTKDLWDGREDTSVQIQGGVGIMIVHQIKSVQEEIDTFLLRLRRFR